MTTQPAATERKTGVRIVDIRCTTPQCGKKLAEALELWSGWIAFKCPRCGRQVRIVSTDTATP